MRPIPNVPKFICDCIVDKTCTQTSNCCPHRIPHAIEENMTCTKLSHECRFAGEGEAVCIPVPVTVVAPVEVVVPAPAIAPVISPETAPSQRQVEYVNTIPNEQPLVYHFQEDKHPTVAPPAFDIPEAVEEALSIPQSPATPAPTAPVQPKTEHKTDRRYRGAKRLAE